jgi:hypothetical protein
MITLARTTATTTAGVAELFDVWADIERWSEHDGGIESIKPDGPLALGTTFTVKAPGGPTLKGTIVKFVPQRHFTDALKLFGARILFIHDAEPMAAGTSVTVAMAVDGPLAWIYGKAIGRGKQQQLETSTAALIARAESAR